MFTIKSVHTYISKLSDSVITPEIIKKLESIEVFLGWLHTKKVISSAEFTRLKSKIVSLKLKKEASVTDVVKINKTALLSPVSNYSEQADPNKRFLLKAAFISVNILILLVSLFYFQKNSFDKDNGSVFAKDTGRVLHYKGRLVDLQGKPIDIKTDVTFKIYDSASGGVPVYIGGCIGERGLEPQYNGKFEILIGEDCSMKRIPSTLFSSTADLYLGIAIGSDKEMKPRQKVAKSSYALQADKLKGMTLGASTNSIPYIDANGRLLIDATAPTLKASSGMFTIEGESVTLQTVDGQGGSIYLIPRDNTIIGSGNVGIGNIAPRAKLDVAGDASISGSLFFTGSNTQIAQLNGGDIAFSTSVSGESNLSPQMKIYNNGNVQIGQGYGEHTLSVNKQATGGSVVGFNNTSNEDNVDTNVLRLAVGTPSGGTLSRFVQFYADSNSGNSGVAVGRIRLNNGNVAYETGGADFAEYFDVADQAEAGHIIAATERGNVKARENESVIGVVSDKAGFIGNAKEDNGNKKIVGLVGQIETFVSTINGDINVGTPVGLSSIPGYGARAIQSGQIVGKALQSLKINSGTGSYVQCPVDMKDARDPNGNMVVCGKVTVIVQNGYYDSNINLTRSNLKINSIGPWKAQNQNQYTVENNGKSLNNLFSALEIFTAKLNAGYILTQELVVKNILTAKNITSEKLTALDAQMETLTAREITSPVITTEKLETETLTTNSIATNTDELEVNLEIEAREEQTASNGSSNFAQFVIKGFEGKTAASIDAAGNATFSGILSAQEATISGDLYARSVTSENIISLENSMDELQRKIESSTNTPQTMLMEEEIKRVKDELQKIAEKKLPQAEYYQNIDNTKLLDNITISSTANIFNASIANNLVVGQMFFKENSITSLASELTISALERINFFNSTIVMSKDGSITAQGGIKTPSVRSTGGGISFRNADNKQIASISEEGTGEFAKIAVKSTSQNRPAVITPAENYERNGLFNSAIETGDTSAGVGMLPRSTEEIIVYNDSIDENSLVYLTSTSADAGSNLSVVEKKSCSEADLINNICKPYFKVVADKQTVSELSFNWLVIN